MVAFPTFGVWTPAERIIPRQVQPQATRSKNEERLLALRAIRDDKALMRQLSEENRKTLESKLKDLDTFSLSASC
ncbi:MAG: hypothetical protein ACUVTO_06850 [Candidatus Caldatribacteriaceae bacterium]